jgi:hypothetical protein
MTGLNTEWALAQLDDSIQATTVTYVASPPGSIGFHSCDTAAREDEVVKQAQVVEQILDRVVSEADLFKQAFSLDAAVTGKARLRRRAPDDSDTYKSVQRGAWVLAEGIYAGIRNPFNHEDPTDIDEQTGLEYLAVLSVLARWVDDAEVEVAP